MTLTKPSNLMLQDYDFLAYDVPMRVMVDKSTDKDLTALREFAELGCNSTFVKASEVSDVSLYLDNAYRLGLGVILQYESDTPTTTYDTHKALIGYYLYDEPANVSPAISIATQETRINAWRAATSRPLMSTFYGQYDLNAAMSPLWDVIFMDWYYRTANTDEENKSLALRAFANLKYTCPQTRVIPMVGPFTETGVCTDIDKRINFSKDMIRFSDNGSYAIFAWIPQSSQFPKSPASDNDAYRACAEFPVIVKGRSKLEFKTLNFNPMVETGQYFIPEWSNANISLNQKSGGGVSFTGSGGICAFDLPAMGCVDIQFLFRNTADASATDIDILETEDAFVASTSIKTFSSVADNTQLSDLVYNSTPAILGIDFTPATSTASYNKFLQGFMIYTNWEAQTF